MEDPHPTRRFPDQKVWVWVPFSSPKTKAKIEKVQGPKRLGATGLRASEGKSASERVSERASEKPLKASKNLSQPLRTSKNLCKPLKTLPLRDPLRGRFPSQRFSVLLPLFICPLNFLQQEGQGTRSVDSRQFPLLVAQH